MKFLIIQPSLSFCYFFHVRSKYSLRF